MCEGGRKKERKWCREAEARGTEREAMSETERVETVE
jgi:hypothetical protein